MSICSPNNIQNSTNCCIVAIALGIGLHGQYNLIIKPHLVPRPCPSSSVCVHKKIWSHTQWPTRLHVCLMCSSLIHTECPECHGQSGHKTHRKLPKKSHLWWCELSQGLHPSYSLFPPPQNPPMSNVNKCTHTHNNSSIRYLASFPGFCTFVACSMKVFTQNGSELFSSEWIISYCKWRMCGRPGNEAIRYTPLHMYGVGIAQCKLALW